MKKHVIITLAVLTLTVTGAIAQTGTSLEIGSDTLFDDFEDGDVTEYDKDGFLYDQGRVEYDALTEEVYTGSYSLKAYKTGNGGGTGVLRTNDSLAMSANESFTVTFAMWKGPKSHFNQCHGIGLTDLNGTNLRICPTDRRQSEEFRVKGTLLSSNIQPTGINVPGSTWFTVKVEVDYASNEVRAYFNDSLVGTTNISQSFSDPDNIKMQVVTEIGTDNTENTYYMYYDDILIETAGAGVTLDLDVNSFMKHGDSQIYTVTLNDSGTETDITDSANVTSGNTTLITVNESQNKLIATSDVNLSGTVNITATDPTSGVSSTETVVIAERTLENIGEMPSDQYVPSVLGIDDETAAYGIGSEIQAALLAVFLGAFAAGKTRNEWLGIGIVLMALIAVWILGYVSLGIVLAGFGYSMMAGLLLLRIPSRSQVFVDAGGRDETP